MQALVERLRKRGFDAHSFATQQEAAAYLMTQIPSKATIGIGGSVTVRDMGLYATLCEKGHQVFWHWEALGEEVTKAREAAAGADVYLCSANAITKDGILCNTDGFGNRVAATIYGPKEVYFLIGRNKICDDVAAAWNRVKNVAAPMNARRLNAKTPCAVTGKCESCLSPSVMCGATVFIERPTGGRTVHILMIDEDLGY